MECDTAIKIFSTLEKNRRAVEDAIEPFITPVYHVRLDATIATDDESVRDFSIRIATVRGGWLSREDWLYVLEVAGEHEVEVDLQNAGMELR